MNEANKYILARVSEFLIFQLFTPYLTTTKTVKCDYVFKDSLIKICQFFKQENIYKIIPELQSVAKMNLLYERQESVLNVYCHYHWISLT